MGLYIVVVGGGGSRSQNVPRSHHHILIKAVWSEDITMVTQCYFKFCCTHITSSSGILMAGRVWLIATPTYNSTGQHRKAYTNTYSCLEEDSNPRSQRYRPQCHCDGMSAVLKAKKRKTVKLSLSMGRKHTSNYSSATLTVNLRIRCVCVVKFRLTGRFGPLKRISVPIEQEAEWAPKPVFTFRKSYITLSLHGIKPRIIRTIQTRLLMICPYAKKQVITETFSCNKTSARGSKKYKKLEIILCLIQAKKRQHSSAI